jgi:hypothetical protein
MTAGAGTGSGAFYDTFDSISAQNKLKFSADCADCLVRRGFHAQSALFPFGS